MDSSNLQHRKSPVQLDAYGRTHGAPYRGHGYGPLRFVGNVVMRMGTQQQQQLDAINNL